MRIDLERTSLNYFYKSSFSNYFSNKKKTRYYNYIYRLTCFSSFNNIYQRVPATINYNINGNIINKPDVSVTDEMLYSNLQPHALKEVTKSAGNINIQNQEITYNAYNLIDDIKEKDYDNNTNELKFYYGTDEYRNKMEMLTNNVVDSTKYYAGNYEVTTKTGENTFVRSATYIPSPIGLAAVFIKDSRDEQQPEGRMFYILQDHLGSITGLVNEAGDLRQEYSFDAWGRRRHPDWQCFSTEELQNFKPLVSRGYTGHEHLDRFGLINMNGRLYDPVLGRMLSPDNFAQNPESSQGYNRYSYCNNNPLKYTDPSGEKHFGAIDYSTSNNCISFSAVGGDDWLNHPVTWSAWFSLMDQQIMDWQYNDALNRLLTNFLTLRLNIYIALMIGGTQAGDNYDPLSTDKADEIQPKPTCATAEQYNEAKKNKNNPVFLKSLSNKDVVLDKFYQYNFNIHTGIRGIKIISCVPPHEYGVTNDGKAIHFGDKYDYIVNGCFDPTERRIFIAPELVNNYEKGYINSFDNLFATAGHELIHAIDRFKGFKRSESITYYFSDNVRLYGMCRTLSMMYYKYHDIYPNLFVNY